MDLLNTSPFRNDKEVNFTDIRSNRAKSTTEALSENCEIQTSSVDVKVSQYFSTAAQILAIEKNLSDGLKKLRFNPPVAYVYNPLSYALDTHSVFVTKYGNTKKKILFVGMNPGPWGMVQTGVSVSFKL